MEVTNTIITLLIPVIIARIVVVWTYPERDHKLWTFGLPTAALLLFVIRVSINRRVEDVFTPASLGATVSWGLLLATQIIATAYTWWPFTKRAGDSANSSSPDYNQMEQ